MSCGCDSGAWPGSAELERSFRPLSRGLYVSRRTIGAGASVVFPAAPIGGMGALDQNAAAAICREQMVYVSINGGAAAGDLSTTIRLLSRVRGADPYQSTDIRPAAGGGSPYAGAPRDQAAQFIVPWQLDGAIQCEVENTTGAPLDVEVVTGWAALVDVAAPPVPGQYSDRAASRARIYSPPGPTDEEAARVVDAFKRLRGAA